MIVVDRGDTVALRDTIRSSQAGLISTELVVASREPEHLRQFLAEQAGGAVRIIAVEGEETAAQATALAAAKGEFVGFISAGDRLPEGTLASLARLIAGTVKIDLVYTDEDWFDDDGRSRPHFKSAWDPEAHLGFDLFGRLCLMRHDLVRGVGGIREATAPAHHYDLHLRVAAASRTSAIYHVARICYSRRRPSRVAPDEETAALARYAAAARAAAAEAASASQGHEVGVEAAPAASFINRVMWPLPEISPLVSIIVPTRDRSDLLQTCVGGILDGTEYQNLELIVVDNGSTETRTLDLFAEIGSDPRVRIVRDAGSFNFSRLVNLGVRHARGSLVALLNNDVEVVSPGWLSDMVALATRSEIGCVGAKLLYGNQQVQHVGIVFEPGPLAMHVFRLQERERPRLRWSAGLDARLSRRHGCLSAGGKASVRCRRRFRRRFRGGIQRCRLLPEGSGSRISQCLLAS